VDDRRDVRAVMFTDHRETFPHAVVGGDFDWLVQATGRRWIGSFAVKAKDRPVKRRMIGSPMRPLAPVTTMMPLSVFMVSSF